MYPSPSPLDPIATVTNQDGNSVQQSERPLSATVDFDKNVFEKSCVVSRNFPVK